MNDNFADLSLKELQALAKKLGIKRVTGVKKQDLAAAVEAAKADAIEDDTHITEADDARISEDAIDAPVKNNLPEQKSQYTGEIRGERKSNKIANNSHSTGRSDVIQNQVNTQNTEQDGEQVCGILEVLQDGFGFIRSDNFMPGDDDVYVPNILIRKFNLRTGDIIKGIKRHNRPEDKFKALVYISEINKRDPALAIHRMKFENLTPIYPETRIHLERPGGSIATRIIDLVSPIGRGQRGMIVSPPKAGKTTLLKEVANAVTQNDHNLHVIILLIDERPEEVTDIKESIKGENVEVIFSTFDETPEHHKRVSEMVVERAKRLVEQKEDVIILLDSITRLARAYNLTVQPSGRTLSGGLDPAALHMPKKFFGAARNVREGGSLTILATALVETGSKMDDVVFEEFKGTGNMELVLDRRLSEKRIFPAIDLAKSGTRRDDLLLSSKEGSCVEIMHKGLNGLKTDEVAERILDLFCGTMSNEELTNIVTSRKYV